MSEWPQDLAFSMTRDGSPTLVHLAEDGHQEAMHNSRGALSESLFVYHSALQVLLSSRPLAIRVLSVGLGLAYNELLTIGEWIKSTSSGPLPSLLIHSYESHEYLREGFKDWLTGPMPCAEANKSPPEGLHSRNPLHQTLNQVLDLCGINLNVDPMQIKRHALNLLQDNNWQFHTSFPAIRAPSTRHPRCNLIYYDAFSNQMTAELWQENLLAQAIHDHADADCVFATYAATGSLNRALKQQGFRLLDKAGFAGKRQCTLAIRGNIR